MNHIDTTSEHTHSLLGNIKTCKNVIENNEAMGND